MAPSRVTFKNAFKIRKQVPGRETIPVPHAFTYMARQHIPNQVYKSERLPRALRGDDQASKMDVFCLVKASMSCTTLCQDPLLCMPGTLQSLAKNFVQTASGNSGPKKSWSLESERKEELRALSCAIAADFPHMQRAVRWYQSMVEGEGNEQAEVPDLPFLRNAPAVGPDLHGFQLGERPQPLRPHELQVVFHRGWTSESHHGEVMPGECAKTNRKLRLYWNWCQRSGWLFRIVSFKLQQWSSSLQQNFAGDMDSCESDPLVQQICAYFETATCPRFDFVVQERWQTFNIYSTTLLINFAGLAQVIAQRNLGEHVSNFFANDSEKLIQVAVPEFFEAFKNENKQFLVN